MARRNPSQEKKGPSPEAIERIVDAHAYAGLVAVGVGCYFIYAPLGLIVPGALLCYLGFFRWAS